MSDDDNYIYFCPKTVYFVGDYQDNPGLITLKEALRKDWNYSIREDNRLGEMIQRDDLNATDLSGLFMFYIAPVKDEFKIMDNFNGEKIKTLKNKPKIFIIIGVTDIEQKPAEAALDTIDYKNPKESNMFGIIVSVKEDRLDSVLECFTKAFEAETQVMSEIITILKKALENESDLKVQTTSTLVGRLIMMPNETAKKDELKEISKN